MSIKAKLNYIRISPRKCRMIADMIRGRGLVEAKDLLLFTVKRPALPILKLLESAESNARNNFEVNPNDLYISKIVVDEGPKLKRWMPRSRGQANSIQKKTSHILVVLSIIDGKLEKIKKRKVSEKKDNKEKIVKREKRKWGREEKIKKEGQKEKAKIFRRKSI